MQEEGLFDWTSIFETQSFLFERDQQAGSSSNTTAHANDDEIPDASTHWADASNHGDDDVGTGSTVYVSSIRSPRLNVGTLSVWRKKIWVKMRESELISILLGFLEAHG